MQGISDDIDTTVYKQSGSPQADLQQRIEIFFLGREHAFPVDKLPITVGREAEKCSLVVQGKLVSREHFSIELRNNKIVLRDTSTNGTWVRLGNSPGTHVKDDYFPLTGSGAIKAGSAFRADENDQLLFKVISR